MTITDTTPPQLCPLNPIELAIVRGIANGDTRTAIARQVDLSPNSMNVTIHRILRKTSAANAPNLVATALRHGWIA